VDIPKSERVAKERQKPLFSDMLDSKLPQVDLLDGALLRQETVAPETLEMTSRLIEKKLRDFGVEVRVVAAAPGPVITRYEIEPATGVKGSQVVNLAKDLARALSLVSIRVIETIPGKNYMALELPNAKRQSIKLSEILGSQIYNEAKSLLTIGLGKDIGGNAVVADLAKMPHCLVAGTTGSGKSVGINAMILSLLYKADARDVRLLLIDPKMLEMSVYEGIPHLLAPVVTDMRQAAHGLNWCVAEMERRYKLMSKLGVRNLAGYNAKIDDAAEREELIYNPFSLTPDQPEPLERLPFIVVVIDELADLMMVVGKKIEELIARLAQKARAAGIHLVLATQRPSVDVITGLIKANIPTRLSFQVSSKIDSRTILDQMGAEALLGMGDMLYMPSGTGFPIRVHGAFVSDEEVHRVVAYLKEQGQPNYIDGVLEGGTVDGEGDSLGDGDAAGEKDPMYDQAVEVVLKNRKASISLVQRHLKIGYNRAARMLEEMEKAGVVSSMSGSGQREILVPARTE
jgi:S-DNA-T family DNA segregation ATPase FtsK/SpoIIIE